MNKFKKFAILSILFTSLTYSSSPYDLTIVGSIRFAESLARLTIGLMDTLGSSIKINFIPTVGGHYDLTGLPQHIKNIALNNDKTPGNVALLVDALWFNYMSAHESVPTSFIKIAYSMNEADEIPQQWVNILNSKFDAVAVPDEYFQDVYKRCGVQIPIFTLPHGMYLDDFLNFPVKQKANTPFVFGMSGGLWPRKNQETLIKAFIQEFSNNKNVKLILHTRDVHKNCENKILSLIRNSRANIELIVERFNHEQYINFLKSLDCYITVSKGEGFSLTPREALAAGIPCILSNNTAHKTICDTNFVCGVKSKIAQPAVGLGFYKPSGCYFNCLVNDVAKAMKDVYKNYSSYLKKTRSARSWVNQYQYRNLAKKYLNLIKPKKIILSNANIITDDYLMTNSKNLYEKYMKIKNY